MNSEYIVISIFIIISFGSGPLGRYKDKKIGKENFSGPIAYVLGFSLCAILFFYLLIAVNINFKSSNYISTYVLNN